MDRAALEMVGHLLPPGLGTDAGCVLLIEQDGGTPQQVQDDIEAMVVVADGIDNRLCQAGSERDKLWNARRSFGKILMAMPKNYFAEDLSVPISAIPEMIARIERLAVETGPKKPGGAHAGEGHDDPPLRFS